VARRLSTGAGARLARIRSRLPERRREGIRASILQAGRAEAASKRTFGPHDLARVEALLASADEVVPLREAFRRRDDWPERFVALRHDLDREVENAVRLAEWEAQHGWRATYFVLHSEWYWGDREEPSPYLLRALERIAGLGHEIAIHNDAVATALRTGDDPVRLLDRALTSLRRHGFDVVGAAAHGNPLCGELGFVNDEIFLECARPSFGAADRTIAWRDPDTGRTRSIRLAPVPMARLGLEYDASRIGHTLYLSDSRGRWSQPLSSIEARFGSEGGFLQVLIHPFWWALSGEPYRPQPVVVPQTEDEVAAAATGDPTAPEMRLVVRGDCCSRRAVSMNRDLFGGNPVMVRDEKARTDFFLDHLAVGSPSREDVTRYLDVDRMSASLRTYALGQTARSTLETRGHQLIVMDSYSDMNFAAWRHRKQGWKLWVNQKFIRDRGEFERDFEPVGQLTLDESLRAHAELIARLRERNGEIPVLYLNQPIAYYPRLLPREEFRRLGLELERSVPNVFYGDIPDDELEPDDLGSCGPGQTLHFTGPTYRKMISVALEKGLASWLKRPATPIASS